jgi:xylose isomerase
MICPSDQQLSDASDQLTDEAREEWVTVIAGTRRFQNYSAPYFNIEKKLAEITNGSYKAKQLNAARVLLNGIGSIDAVMREDSSTFDSKENREGVIEYAVAVIFGASRAKQATGSRSTSAKIRW